MSATIAIAELPRNTDRLLIPPADRNAGSRLEKYHPPRGSSRKKQEDQRPLICRRDSSRSL